MEENVIDLKQMFIVIFRKFGNCVKMGIIFALLLAGYKVYDVYHTLNDEELLAKADAEYEKSMFDYEKEKESLQTMINMYDVQIASLDEYLANSLKMQLDPYALSVSREEYLIDTHYQINPTLTYQDKDKTQTVVNAYRLALESGSFYDYIKEKMNINTKASYIEEIIRFQDLGNGIISIEVSYLNEDEAKKMSNYIESYLLSRKSEMEKISEHDFTPYNSTVYTVVNESLASFQENKVQQYQNVKYNLQQSEIDLLLLKEPSAKKIDTFSLVKEPIKFGIIGFLIGGVLLGMIYAFAYLLNTKVCNEKELYERYHVRVFGSVNVK